MLLKPPERRSFSKLVGYLIEIHGQTRVVFTVPGKSHGSQCIFPGLLLPHPSIPPLQHCVFQNNLLPLFAPVSGGHPQPNLVSFRRFYHLYKILPHAPIYHFVIHQVGEKAPVLRQGHFLVHQYQKWILTLLIPSKLSLFRISIYHCHPIGFGGAPFMHPLSVPSIHHQCHSQS